MKKHRFWSAALAMALTAMLPLTALAKQWNDVDSWEKLSDAFEDTDADVTIVLTGDIQFADSLTAKEGQTYVINGREYTLTDVEFYGKGAVEINADVDNKDNGTALDVTDAKVTVNGNVTSDHDALDAYGEADVTVNGNATGDHDGVYASGEANVTVNGNVDAGRKGVYGKDESKITVNGNVDAGDTGVDARDDASVKVDGNVTGKDYEADPSASFSAGSVGVEASENATVEVTGDVKGGNITGEAVVGGEGVHAFDESKVTVGGNVTGGNADGENKAVAGSGIVMDSTANVSVGGDAKGGNAKAGQYATGGSGVIILCLNANDRRDADAYSNGEQIIINGTLDGEIVPRDENTRKPGSLLVKGSVEGGKAVAPVAIEGAGVYYSFDQSLYDLIMSGTDNEAFAWNGDIIYPDWNDIKKPYRNLFPSEDVSDAMLSIYLSSYHMINILEAMAKLGYMTEEQSQAAYNAAFAAFLEKFVEAYPEIANYIGSSSGAEMENFLNSLSADDAQKIWDMYLEALRPVLDPYVKAMNESVLADSVVPTVTIWGAKSNGEQDPVTSSLGADLANLLNADINYIIRVLPSENGTLSADKETANPGETVTVTAKANAGYRIGKVMVSGKEIQGKDGVYTFTMPDYGYVEVSAEFVSTESGAPRTGDSAGLGLWFSLAFLAAGAAFVTYKRRANA